jgi:hypothetical protein
MRAAWLLLLGACTCGSKGDGSPDAPPPADARPGADAGPVAPADPRAPAVARGGQFFGQPERFNRYYTDPGWRPTRTVNVTPATVAAALAEARPGDEIVFARGDYAGCYELAGEDGGSGTYDAPIVLYAERNPDGTRGVRIDCCGTGRRTCINLEGADHVAVDGFILRGGKYGVRAVGLGEDGNPYESSKHQKGVAVLDVDAAGQAADPFLTGASDWAVFERNLASDAGAEDGHGIYLSNGSDWNIVRYNAIWNCPSAAFQINADPASTCADIGMPYTDPECFGPAEQGQGQGVSEYILYEGNTIHDVYSTANFTSVRNSIVVNSVFAFGRHHGVSFWQEVCGGGCDARYGSRNNRVHHNLFAANDAGYLMQFINQARDNDVRNNVFLAVNAAGAPQPGRVLVEVDGSSQSSAFAGNFYVSGSFDGHAPVAGETRVTSFDTGWLRAFPSERRGSADDWRPTATTPWRDQAAAPPGSERDYDGKVRGTPADLGPFEE